MSLSQSLLRIREQAARLNEVADAATKALDQVENFLIGTNAGISVSVPMPDDLELKFVKTGGGYRLIIKYPDSWSHWQETPREVKILAAAHLHALIAALLHEIEKQTANALSSDTLKEIARATKSIETLEGSKLDDL